jgi:hypothetical protein
MPSEDFERFRWSCFDPSFYAGHDGLDVAALRRLTGSERAEAERLVLEALPTTTDERPIQAAGYLKLQAASAILKQRLASDFDAGREWNRVDTAVSLHLIERYLPAADIVINVLWRADSHEEWTIMAAVDALKQIGPSAPVFEAMMERLAKETNSFMAYYLAERLEELAVQAGAGPALDGLAETDRSRLEASLMPRLEATRDSRLVIPLGLLRSQAAVPLLRKLLADAAGTDRVRLALALYRIQRFPDAEDIIVEVLHRTGLRHQADRVEAVRALSRLETSGRILATLLNATATDLDARVVPEAFWALRRLCAGNRQLIEGLDKLEAGGHWNGAWRNATPQLVGELHRLINTYFPT